MLKKILAVTIPLSFIILLVGCSPGKIMVHENESPYEFDKTVELITGNAKERGWMVPKTYDFQKSLIAAGQPDPGRIKIIKLCHPKYAGPLLRKDDSKFIAVMMPCSVAVYEKSDGNTYVTSMNMGLMSSLFSGEVGSTLSQVAEEDEIILRFVNSE
jgi:uncharacterized protein (DUF302 family)